MVALTRVCSVWTSADTEELSKGSFLSSLLAMERLTDDSEWLYDCVFVSVLIVELLELET